MAKVLAAGDPSNAGWQSDLAVSFGKLGDVAVSAGKLEDARGWFEKALAVVKALAAADPSNAGWQRDLAVSYDELARTIHALRANGRVGLNEVASSTNAVVRGGSVRSTRSKGRRRRRVLRAPASCW